MLHRETRIGAAAAGILSLAIALLFSTTVFGCGREESSSARVASMVAPSPASDDASAVEVVPTVESVELDPRRPIAGTRVRARARLARGASDEATLDYRWQTASGRVLGDGRDLDTQGLEPGTRIEVVVTPRLGEEVFEPVVHGFRLAAEAAQLALVVIDAPDGKRVGSVLRAVVETTEGEAGFDDVSYEWRVDGEVVGEEEELDTTPFAPGVVVELRARPGGRLEDGKGRVRPVFADPIVLEAGAPPEITSRPSSGLDGGLFRYAIAATTSARGAKLRYEIVKGPEGMTVDPSTGVVQWRPAESQRGQFEVEVAVFDQWGSGVAQSFVIGAESPAPPAAAD